MTFRPYRESQDVIPEKFPKLHLMTPSKVLFFLDLCLGQKSQDPRRKIGSAHPCLSTPSHHLHSLTMAQREVHRDMVAGMLDEDMPDSVRDDLIRMIVGSDSDDSSSSGVGSYKSSSSSDNNHQQEEKLHTYTTRRRFKKRNPTESLWHTRYLACFLMIPSRTL